jgi:hypothetical protein
VTAHVGLTEYDWYESLQSSSDLAIDPVDAQRVAERFINTASTGSMRALLEVLDPEAAGRTVSGGLVPSRRVTAWLEGATPPSPMTLNCIVSCIAGQALHVVAAIRPQVGAVPGLPPHA